jgi:rhodanese-related sulfurtransferase
VPNLKGIITVIAEAAVVALVGAGAGLAANKISPRGLDLSRNYFPSITNHVAAIHPAPVAAATNAAPTEEQAEAAQLSDRLRDKGLQEIKRAQVQTLLHDPRYQDGRVVFVDARPEDGYEDGHIPGAYELDPYHPEKQLATVLPACNAAEQVVVYCTGGECEDGDTVAIMLKSASVEGGKIFVYGGGFHDWATAHLPVETGARNSGTMRDAK